MGTKPRRATHHCEVTADVLDEDEILRNLRPTAPRRLHRSIFALTRVKLGADLETQVGQVQLWENPEKLEVADVLTYSRTFLFLVALMLAHLTKPSDIVSFSIV